MSQAETIVALTCATIAIGCLYGVIPWVTRCGSLYMLHNLRDSLYEVGDDVEGVRDTLFYSDVEYLVTLAIHSVRDLSYGHAVGYLAAYLPKANRTSGARAAQYANELDTVFVGESGAKALNVMREVVQEVPGAMILRVACGHPVVLALVIVCVPVIMLMGLIRGGKKDNDATVSSPEAELSVTVSIDPSATTTMAPLRGVKATIVGLPKVFAQIRGDSIGARHHAEA